jgi:hypothetical protein
MENERRSSPAGPGTDDGLAVVGVLVLATLLMALALIGIRGSQVDLRIAGEDFRAARALAIAEAGLDHAVKLIMQDNDGFDDELASAGTGGALAGLGPVVSLAATNYRYRSMGVAAGDGYYVRAADNYDETSGPDVPNTDRDATIEVISLGRAGQAERVVSATVAGDTSGPRCAVLFDGDISFPGNSKLSGSRGCAHANRDMSISGNPSMSAGASASDDMTISGNPTMEGAVLDTGAKKSAYADDHDRQPGVEIPSVRPFSFGPNGVNLAQAVRAAGGYRFDSNCRIYQGGTWSCSEAANDCTGGTMIANLSSGQKWNGWSCSSDSSSRPPSFWSLSGNSTVNGAFFVEGWVNVSGNPGSSAVPWLATIIALNTIDISGTPTMAPSTSIGQLRNLLLVSGNDIGLSGNLGATTKPGAIFAHQQIKNNGNVVMNGFLIGEDGKTTWGGDPAPSRYSGKDVLSAGYELSGNVDITYNGLDTSGYGGAMRRVRWRELRGS